MTVNVEVISGSFNGVVMQGICNYYNTTNNTVMKGNFVNGKLTGTNNTFIEFTNTTFKCYIGTFLNNKPDGNIIEYEFMGNGDLLSDIISGISVTKRNCLYTNNICNILTETITTVSINISYKTIESSNDTFMTAFDIIEI